MDGRIGGPVYDHIHGYHHSGATSGGHWVNYRSWSSESELRMDAQKTALRHLAEAVLENLPECAVEEACERLLLIRRKWAMKKKDAEEVPEKVLQL